MASRFGRRLLVVPLALLALSLAPSVASPAAQRAAQIVVFGAYGGTHMTLATKGDHGLVVKGHMATATPLGCRFVRYRRVAVCSLAHATSIEIRTGPSGDFVRVLDRMPVPVVAYTGAGRDKFYGNDEPDTCFTQGSKKNRCVGKGGNDVCITGEKNSDCIGNAGNDYCQHGAGSDGCWGGPGDDVCKMGPGKDGCHGGPGHDIVLGGADGDQLYGGPGHDYCNGQGGLNDTHGCERGPKH